MTVESETGGIVLSLLSLQLKFLLLATLVKQVVQLRMLKRRSVKTRISMITNLL